jgi:hypothetical protein
MRKHSGCHRLQIPRFARGDRLGLQGQTLVLVAVAVVAAGIGCTSPRPRTKAPSGPVTSRDGAWQLPTRAEVFERDAGVGEAHNAAIDQFRRELREPGVIAGDLCEHIARGDRHARQVLARTPLCAGMVTQLTARAQLSPLATRLMTETERAIDMAPGPAELDQRLAGIVRASMRLEPTEQVAVTSAVSVARHSIAYWSVNLEAFGQEIEAEYRACLERYRTRGKAADHLRNICLRGADDAVAPGKAVTPTLLRQAGTTRSRRCAGYDYRAVAKDDARGAFIGALLGAAPGAVTGGSAASIASGVQDTWSMMTCAVGDD